MNPNPKNVLAALNIQKENRFFRDHSPQWLESINPTTEQPIAKIALATENHYEKLLTQTCKASDQWGLTPAPKRGEFVRLVGQALREHKDALGSLISLEMGKTKQEGDGEVQEMIDMADFAVGQSRMLYGKTMHSERLQHRMYEQWHPLGVIGIITAFNFPMAVWAWNAFIAAICGNAVVWKPSHKTPLCALAIQQICNQLFERHRVPPIFGTFVGQTMTLGKRFLEDKRVSLISFTGSCKTGAYVQQCVNKRMGRTLLELGGNNAMIIDETANLELAIPAVVFGAIGTTGQRCTTTRRLLIHESVYQEVKKRLVHAYQQIRIGDPLDQTNLIGPVIDQEGVDIFETAMERIKKLGGNILFGGKRLKQVGFFVEPTLVEANANWDLLQEETFAPILFLLSYQSIEEAIAIQNNVPQGLSSALFTNNLQHAERFLSVTGSDCGIANVNIGTSGAEIGGAFGGEKATGGGREAGSDAWKNYMRRQTTTINWGNDLPLAQGIKFQTS